MTLSNFNVNDLNSLFDHIEIIHADIDKFVAENEQLRIELKELKEKLIRQDQELADKNVHIIQLHKDLDRQDELLDNMLT
jgi:regulator of replication initiation timing